MLCANIIDNEIVFVEEKDTINLVNLASYNEILNDLCSGEIEVEEFTMVKEGILIWNEEECELDLFRVNFKEIEYK